MGTNLNFDIICRTCMTEQKEMTHIMLNSIDSNARQISTMLTSFVSIQLSEQDGLPLQICQQCLNQVHKSYYFKLQCERNDSLLRHYAEHTMGLLQEPIILQDVLNPFTNNMFEKDLIEPKVEIFDSTDALAWFPDTLLQHLSDKALEKLLASIKTKWDDLNNESPDTTSKEYFENDEIKQEMEYELSPHMEKKHKKSMKRIKRELLKQKRSEKKMKKEITLDHPNEKKKELLCSLCGKSFSNAGVLHSHQRVHTGERPYECKTCGKRFQQLGNLKAHEPVHTGFRAYLCYECGNSFRTQSALCVHQRIHTGVKTMECKVCGMRMNGSLARHMATHSNEKPYSCDLCKKTFAHIAKLKLHQRLHADERKFLCDICNKGFNRRDYLRQHMRIHTGEKPFICQECGAAFSQAHCLATHKKMHKV